MAEEVPQFYDDEAAIQMAYLQHGVDAGYFRADLDVASAARAVNGMIHATMLYSLRDPSKDAIDKMTHAVREIVYYGLSVPSGGTRES